MSERKNPLKRFTQEKSEKREPQLSEHVADDLDVNSIDFLSKALSIVDQEKDDARIGPYLHLSSLLKTECPRQIFLRQLVVDPHEGLQQVNSATRVMWAIGRGIEVHVKDQLIKSIGFSNVIGKWVCACSKTKHDGRGDASLSCPYCKTKVNKYEELDLIDHESQVAGHPDLLFVRNGLVYPVECKSIVAHAFEKLTEANVPASYRRQLFGYAVLLKKNGYKVAPHGWIIFVNKDFKWSGSPYRTFLQPFTKGPIQTVLQGLFKLAKQVKEYRQLKDEGENVLPLLPKRLGVCSGSRTPTAKQCDMCSYCFLYPSE